ncbi:hypothetical protein Pst134EA_027708 [Puccinia striiformis f. sp. tritici]|uniref:hypothetical protein n=1 Tax=Puccinia striiformis f. sp. tritici TaxID=168172 RepID=UPI002008E973|nr:hypothetical protein Pst134EA_027708 [Puccinia striiformis f. sp. tritici]KAH9448396.1 hypothetical protein Pst134EA_027708 [Puccinia striiformis f. sp. tritici]
MAASTSCSTTVRKCCACAECPSCYQELDTGINSEAILHLRTAFDVIDNSLYMITLQLRSYHRGDLTLDAARLDSMRTSVDELSEAVESCLANLSSHLIPSLGRAKLVSLSSDCKSWSLDLKQLWDEAEDRKRYISGDVTMHNCFKEDIKEIPPLLGGLVSTGPLLYQPYTRTCNVAGTYLMDSKSPNLETKPFA